MPVQTGRARLVELLAGRGIRDGAVLGAMGELPREVFVPGDLAEAAYDDVALPIGLGQTISQPYIVALMTQALELEPTDRVLEIGTGSGYAAAVLGRIAGEVHTIERHAPLVTTATERLREVGVGNVVVHHGDGSDGWPERAPYDAIVATAVARTVPDALREQLAIGGRLVIPVGELDALQKLLRIRRTGPDSFEQETLELVKFVPLLPGLPKAGPRTAGTRPVDDLDGLLERVGDARLVLLGEASHGSSEFYRMRQRITQALIERAGFGFVAAEADWPDAARIDAYVRRADQAENPLESAFERFPQWMWRNTDVLEFVDWLRDHNDGSDRQVAFHGLDLYSLHASIQRVLGYLDEVDPELGEVARRRYGCLTPYESNPAAYGLAAVSGRYRACEEEVVAVLQELCRRRGIYRTGRGEEFLDAEQNAAVGRDAERYYRAMYYGGDDAWNVRDRHMFTTLQALLAFHGPEAKGIVWAHNSHLGDARATSLGARGQLNLGQLVRAESGVGSYHVGFGSDHGTVLAAPAWGQEPKVMQVRPALAGSYEQMFHEAGPETFLLPLRRGDIDPDLRRTLTEERLQRAIGVVYRPQTERASHYFPAKLATQFDEYCWFDETSAVTPLAGHPLAPTDPRHPFATLDS